MESIHDGYLPGADVGNHLGDEEGSEFRSYCASGPCPVAYFVLEGVHASYAYTVHHSDAILVCLVQVDAAVLYALDGSCHGILAVEIHLASFLAVYAGISGVESFYLAGKLRLEVRGIEMRDRRSTANPIHHGLPCVLGGIAQWANGSYARHDNSFQFHLVAVIIYNNMYYLLASM